MTSEVNGRDDGVDYLPQERHDAYPEEDSVLAIVGAGAVGGLLGALVRRQSSDVVLVATKRSERLLRDGFDVESGTFGSWRTHVEVSTAVPPGASVLLTVKTPHLAQVLEPLSAAAPAQVLCLQNGLEHADLLRRALPPDVSVAAGAVYVEAAREDHEDTSRVIHRSPFLRLALPHDGESSTSRLLAGAGVDVSYDGSEQAVLWQKLEFLAPLALLTAYHEAPLAEALRADPELTASLLDEIAAVSRATGRPSEAWGLRRRLEAAPPAMRSSLQRDIELGRPDELDAIGGCLLRLAEAHNVPAPQLGRAVEALGSRSVG